MTEIIINNEPCKCPVGQCAHFLDDDTLCINRRPGNVRTSQCERCMAATWHQNGSCLRCQHNEPAS